MRPSVSRRSQLARLPGLAVAAGLIAGACGADAGAAVPTDGRPSASAIAVVVTPAPRPTPSPTASPPPAPSPAPDPTPAPTATAAVTPPATGPFEMNLYHRNDFASQATKDSCVAGAMLTMLNVGDVTNTRSRSFQLRIGSLANRLSGARDGGTEPEGWAAALEREGLGRYVVDVAPSRPEAIRRAALAIRATGRPVGLLVWRGAHSWVMHGFRATGDPLTDPTFKVTHAWVSDPWYPRVSSIWGPSNPPNTLVPARDLRIDYLPWRRPTGAYPDKDGRYVLVLPVDR
jgi:hypothetical protein